MGETNDIVGIVADTVSSSERKLAQAKAAIDNVSTLKKRQVVKHKEYLLEVYIMINTDIVQALYFPDRVAT